MKKLSFLSLLALIFMLTTASMCSSDDNSSSSQNPTPVINLMTQGTWRITSFIESDNNETANFSGYAFTFGASNVLTATNGVNAYTGSWSVTADNSTDDDDPSGDLDFTILFASPINFIDLSDDWDIVSQTSTKIQLIDISGGNGGTDYLTFEKN
ncbi:hypothetical protein [Flavobacterium sp. GT3R68]|uniref:hypothetical protein n=1 Tax=Flavobacterium sp. GT3R68 TaxID=2594437 RepID=UPI000F87D5C8|nr:hypothetical protein [Flavobacterium sp. GT3R68]RTY93378.1 hypothetical protein EKL32_16095 [Flavobacterium sp. GSN2]TRW92448.1 hypothetical protein FNW07_05445 [Flavobacterium sp. GT3R68]